MGELTTTSAAPLALKGELAELLGDQLGTGDLSSGVKLGFPVLSIKGKVFHIREGGEAELVTQPGTDEPATSIEVVLIKANPHISKVYYETGYEEGADAKPTCFSNDGIRPSPESEQVQCSTCASCPKNQWGSRIADNGAKLKACSDSRRVAVAPAGDLDRIMLLRVPAASLKPLMQYGQTLAKRGIPYQAVVTKLSFDYTVAHPLIKLSPARAVTVDDGRKIKEALSSEIVEAILYGGGPEEVAEEVKESGELDELAEAAKGAAEAIGTQEPMQAKKPEPTPAVSTEAVAEAVGEKPAATKPKRQSKKTEAAAPPAATMPPAETPVAPAAMENALDSILSQFDD